MESDDERLEIVEVAQPSETTLSCDDDSGVVVDDAGDINCPHELPKLAESGQWVNGIEFYSPGDQVNLTTDFTVDTVSDEDDGDGDEQAKQLASTEDMLTAEALQLEHSDSDESTEGGRGPRELEDGELDDDDNEPIKGATTADNLVKPNRGPGESGEASTTGIACGQVPTEAKENSSAATSSTDVKTYTRRKKITAEDSWAKQVESKLRQGKRRHSEEEEEELVAETDESCVYVVGASPTQQSPQATPQPHVPSLSHGPMYGEDYLECLSPNSTSKRRKYVKSRQTKMCYYYMEGRCQKGEHCDYAHGTVPIAPLRMRLCRFYARECCAKRSECKYLHKEFPCKIYHLGGRCFTDGNCKYSHAPLTEDAQKALSKHIVTGPSDILADFPRLSQEEIVGKIDTAMEKRAKGEEPGFTFENIDQTRYTHLVKDPATPATAMSSSSSRPLSRPWRAQKPVSGGGRCPRSFVDTSRQRERRDRPPGAERRGRRRRSRDHHHRRRAEERESRRRRREGPSGETEAEQGGADVSHLPANQRQLYMRIQHNQKNNVPREETPQPSEEEAQDAEDSWYSSDEEGAQPLTAVLKQISAKPLAPGSADHTETVAADTMGMDAISDLLKQIQNSTEKTTRTSLMGTDAGDCLGAPSASNPTRSQGWTTANFHDVFWGGELSPERRTESKPERDTAKDQPSIQSANPVTTESEANVAETQGGSATMGSTDKAAAKTANSTSLGYPSLTASNPASGHETRSSDVDMRVQDVDFRVPDLLVSSSTEQKNGEDAWPSVEIGRDIAKYEQMGWAGCDDLSLPFKPVFLTPCIEINASSTAHPPMFWTLTETQSQGPDYSRLRARLGEVLSRTDPRLRLLRRRNTTTKHSSVQQVTMREHGANTKECQKARIQDGKETMSENRKENVAALADLRQRSALLATPPLGQNARRREPLQDPRRAARQQQLPKATQEPGAGSTAQHAQQLLDSGNHFARNQDREAPSYQSGHDPQRKCAGQPQAQMTSTGFFQQSQHSQVATAEHYQQLEQLGMMTYQQFLNSQPMEGGHSGYSTQQSTQQHNQMFAGLQQPPPPPPEGAQYQGSKSNPQGPSSQEAPVHTGSYQQQALTPGDQSNGTMTMGQQQHNMPMEFQQYVATPMDTQQSYHMYNFHQQQMKMHGMPPQTPNMFQHCMPFEQPQGNHAITKQQQQNQAPQNQNQTDYMHIYKSTSSQGVTPQQQYRNLGPMLPPQMQMGPAMQSTNCPQILPLLPTPSSSQPVSFASQNSAKPHQPLKSQRQKNGSRRARRNRWQAAQRAQAQQGGVLDQKNVQTGANETGDGADHAEVDDGLPSQAPASSEQESTRGQPEICQVSNSDPCETEVHFNLDDIELPKTMPPEDTRQSPVKHPQLTSPGKDNIPETQNESYARQVTQPLSLPKYENSEEQEAHVHGEKHVAPPPSDEAGNRSIFSPPKEMQQSGSDHGQGGQEGAETSDPVQITQSGGSSKTDSPLAVTQPWDCLNSQQSPAKGLLATPSHPNALLPPPPPLTRAPLSGVPCTPRFPSLAAAGLVSLASPWPAMSCGEARGLLPTPPSLLGRVALVPAVLSRHGRVPGVGPGPRPAVGAAACVRK